ncbi:MAG: tetratricopeptide repeat protein [Planctomycetota bacterium]|jgi:tetratricopeptide (TPR) repeat protein
MSTTTETIENATQHHQDVHLRQAEQMYRLILQSNPDNPVALHSLGVIAHQKGNHDAAVELISKAIANNPQIPQFHNTLGLIFEVLEKYEEAVAAYQMAVSIKPDYTEAYHNMAVALQSQNQYVAAVEKCKQAVSIKPDYAEAYNTMAFSLEKQQQYTEAIKYYKKAVQFKPDFAEAYNHLGVLLNAQGHPAEAINNYKQALWLDQNYAEVHNNLGIALKEQKQFTEAISCFEKAIQLEPDFAEAYYNLANSLRDETRSTEAIENYRKAVRLKPDYAEAYNHLGVVLNAQGGYAENIENLEAIENYRRALQLNPDFAEAHWNLSLVLLRTGRLIEGWKEYKWRRNPKLDIATYPHSFETPRWDGLQFKGKRLLVHYEQGLGDTLHFVRYVPMVKARGGTVILEVRKPLYKLLQSFSGVDELIEASLDNKPVVKFDYHVSLMDLPKIFETTLETIPAEVPYINCCPTKAEYWRKRLTGADFKVGVVWAGSPTHGNDRYRSCTLKHFAPLIEVDSVRLYGLQKGEAAAQTEELANEMAITNLGTEFEDFADTAAAIENLDMVISVDTSVLHLAGAMGKPAWALLPFSPDWRWMLDRMDSPWYPTMKLFRQKKWGQWEPVVQDIAEELRTKATNHKIENHSLGHRQVKMIPAIIPYYKNKNQLNRCIAHLNKQTIKGVEIFIRDNSNDNIYFTTAVNEGLKKYLSQSCEYILVLNQDMYLEPSAVEIMTAFMNSHLECGIGAPLQLNAENPNYVICGGSYEAFPLGKHQHGPLSEFTEDEQILWCNGACMILRKEMIREIGLLDENFVFIGSDSDYCFTARSRGWQIWRIAGARGIHEHGASGVSGNMDIEMLKIKDMIHFGRKWLNGELYKEMAYEGKNYTPEIIDNIMNQLRDAKSRLEHHDYTQALKLK